MREASGLVQDGSRGGSFQEYVGFLAISAWNRGKVFACLPLGDGEERSIRLGVGVHEQFGEQVGVIAGVVVQDVGRQVAFSLGTFPVPEDRRQRSCELVPHRAQGVEPSTEIDRIDTDQGLRHLAPHRLPVRAGGVIIGEGTRCREHAHFARLGGIEN